MGNPIEMAMDGRCSRTRSGREKLRLAAPQFLEDMYHERGGDDRGDEINQGQREQRGDDHPAGKDASAESMTHPPRPRNIEPSQRHHLEIFAAKKISVQPKEKKDIYPRRQQIDRERQ